jgi:hypothetical protein
LESSRFGILLASYYLDVTNMAWEATDHRSKRVTELAGASRAADPVGRVMAKPTTPAQTAEALSVPARLPLLRVAAGIDFEHAKIAERVVTEAVVKGLIERDAGGHLALTDHGRVVLRTMLPEPMRRSTVRIKSRIADLGATMAPGSPADCGKVIAEETEK